VSLDFRTGIFADALVLGVSTLVLCLFAGQSRRRFSGELGWAEGYGAMFLSQVLVGLRGMLPPWLSIVAGNSLAAIGIALIMAGTELFLGQRPRTAFYIAMVSLTAISAVLFGLVFVDARIRILALNFACAAECGAGALAILRQKREPLPKLLRETAATVILIGLLFLGRCAALPIVDRADWLRSGSLDLAFMLVIVATVLALSFFLRRLVSERLWNELDEALADRELVVKEMHHRTKNDLALVAGLLSLEADAGPPELGQRLALVGARVHTIGLVHDMLHELGATRDVRLDDYLGLLAEKFSTGEKRRKLETRLEPLTLDSKRAVSVGLIVNELVTNALRHAFPDNREGHVLIGLSTRPAADQSGGGGTEAVITVADDGIGLSSAGDKPGGLGSAIVQALTDDLKGSLAVDSSAEGTRIELAFRL